MSHLALSQAHKQERSQDARHSHEVHNAPAAMPEIHSGGFSSLNPTLYRKSSCACGGGCPSCQSNSSGLKISQPSDAAEIEADQIADRVMRMPAGTETATPTNQIDPGNSINRKCDACDDEEERIQRKPLPAAGGTSSQNPGYVNNVISSGGQPLDRTTRHFFEPRLGRDLSAVRIHTDSAASESANAVDARAYTLGSNIVFANGEYAPHSESGRHLIAHELAHVVQGAGARIGNDVIHRNGPTSEDVWGFTVTTSMCRCRQDIRDDIDWANTAARTYAACDTPLNATSTDVEACFDAAQPGTTVAGSTSASGTMTLPPPTADPCERVRNHTTRVHETFHARHTDSIAQAQGPAFFAEWRRLAGNPNRLTLLRATFPAEVAAFRAQWHDGHDWAQDEVNSYTWERRFLVDVESALSRICP